MHDGQLGLEASVCLGQQQHGLGTVLGSRGAVGTLSPCALAAPILADDVCSLLLHDFARAVKCGVGAMLLGGAVLRGVRPVRPQGVPRCSESVIGLGFPSA